MTDWVQSASGRRIWPMNLKVEDVCVSDIAAHLSKQGRFSGATSFFYSVAQHSVLVSVYCDPKDALWGLLHDASEYVLQDIPRPLKLLPEFDFYRDAESRAMDVICKKFGLAPGMPYSVHEADNRMLATEARDLMSPLHPEWRVMHAPYARRIAYWPPDVAEVSFMRRFRALTETPEQAHADAMAYRCMEAA